MGVFAMGRGLIALKQAAVNQGGMRAIAVELVTGAGDSVNGAAVHNSRNFLCHAVSLIRLAVRAALPQ